MLSTLIEMVKIKSVSGDIEKISDILRYVKKYFKGKKVFIREFNYQDASPIMLISNQEVENFDIISVGHLDVVPADNEPFNPKVIENKLYGRGALDMKWALVVAFESMGYILDNKIDIAFAILITTDEETTSNGIKAFVKNEKIGAKIVIDNDAGNLDTIVEKYKHSVGVKITSKGLSGHSSQPWNSINAVNKLMEVLKKLYEYFPEYSKEKKMPKDTWVDTMNITAFNSPKTLNITPDWAEAIINFRLTEKTTLNDLEKILHRVCKNGSCIYEIIMASCGCYMDANSQHIQSYKRIAEEIIGQKIKIDHMNGATDARMFADKSVVIMHGANGADIHNPNECLEIDSMYKIAEIQKKFINEIANEKRTYRD